jgi:uncharacterized membrane protein
MHILGGFGVAALAGSILSYNGMNISYWKLFIAFIVVAIAWEIYEYIHDILIARMWNGWFDTTKDIIDGYIGMSIAYFFTRK